MKNKYLFIIVLLAFTISTIKSFSQCATPTTTTGSRCGEGSVSVSANSATGNYRWYDASSGGNILGNSSSFNTPVITANTTYYVSEFNIGTTNDALDFDGANDYVAIHGMNFITTELEVITIEAWVNTSVSGGGIWDNWSIVDFDRSEYFNLYLRGDNGLVGFSTTDNSSHTDDFYGTTAVNDGNWHHIAAVYDGTDKRIYVDGVLDATNSNPHGAKKLGTGITRYGFIGDGSEADTYNGGRNSIYFDGSIDEVRVWSTVRSAADISNNYNKCVLEGQDDLMLYYRMDGASGDNLLIDYSGNNYNGTLINMDLAAVWIAGNNLSDCPNCESARATVSAQILTPPALDLGADKCVPNGTITLDAGDGGGTFTSYIWNNGATSQTINVNSNGTYTVEVEHNVNACKSSDAVTVSLLDKPDGTDNERCGEGTVALEVNNPTSTTYYWYDVAIGGTAIGSGVDFTTPSVLSTTSFYVANIDNTEYKEALNFDGVDDKVALDGYNYNGVAYTEMTVEAWIRTSDGDDQIIASFDRSEYWRLEVNGAGAGTGQIGFDIYTDNGILDFGGTTLINDGNWHHVAAVYDNGVVSIYVDGALDASTTKGTKFGTGTVRYGFIGTGSEAVVFNGTASPPTYFNGGIDEVRIWDVARTQTQIQNSKDGCLLGTEAGLVSYYKMEDGTGTTLSDHSNNNNEGTLVNMTNAAWINTGENIECSCGESDREEVVAGILSTPVLDLGTDQCVSNTSYTIDAGNGGGTFTTYSWNTGATTQTISVNSNGTYTVEVGHNANICKSTDAISVSLLSKPDGTDKDRCGEGTLDLTVDNPSTTTYHWFDVATGGTAVGTGVDFTTPSLAAAKSYFVAEIDNAEHKEALHFDGNNDRVAIDNLFYNSSNYTEMTVEAWIRTSDASDHIIASFDRSEYWRLEINGSGAGSGKVGFDIATDDGILDFGGSTVISDGAWHHIAAVFNAGSVKIYVDGYLDASTTKGTKFGTGVSGYGYIGVGSEARSFNHKTGPDDYFNGDIDEVRIWNVARNISQIQNSMNGCLLGSETGLQAYYKMEDGSGTTLSDHSNNNSIGTLFNMSNASWISTGKNIECSCGESDRREIIATINAIPTVNLGVDRCEAAAVNLDAGNAGGGHTYEWQDGSTNQTLNAATSKQYWAHVTETATSCVGADTVVISIGTTAKPIATDSARCGNGDVLLQVSSSNTVRWYDAASGGSLLSTGTSYTATGLSSNTDFFMTGDDGACGESARKKVTATIHPEVTALTTTKSWPGDNGTVIILSSAGGSGNYDYMELQGNFDYAGSFSAANVEKTVPNGGSYNIKVKDENGCEYTTNGVATNPIPTSIATSAHNSASLYIPQSSEWYYVTDNNSKAIIAIKSGSNSLGKVDVELYIDGSTGTYDGYAFMKRHYVINVENQPSSSVDVKLLFSTNEYNSIKSAAANTPEPLDDIATIADIGVTKYEGPSENGNYNPADATSLAFISQSSSGNDAGGKYIIIQTSSFSEFWPHASGGGSALPIELIRFEAAKVNNDIVLSWTTATELNNDYFSLQRSVDGKEFSTIAKIDGAGNSNSIINYQYLDSEPLSGMSYYRLKQTDFDGKFAFSKIITVSFAYDNEANVAIYPNPTSSNINMYFDGFVNDNKVEMSIYSVNGKRVLTKAIPLSKNGDGNISMNIEQLLPAGVYIVRIIGENNIITNKIIIE